MKAGVAVKKKTVKRVMLIDRIRVELSCPHCGNDITVSQVTAGNVSVCSECAGQFRISRNAEIRFPKLLRYFLLN